MTLSSGPARASLRSRLILIITSVSMITLLLAILIISIIQVREYKLTLAENLTALAAVVAENVKAAVMFDDAEDASRFLSELNKDERIVSAVIVIGNSNDEFASYHVSDEYARDYQIPSLSGYQFQSDSLDILEPITLDDGNELIGHIYLRASLNSLYDQFERNILIILGIVGLSLLFCLLLAAYLQKKISAPILEILSITEQIRDEKDYSLRVNLDDYQEISQLSKGFNQMLGKIENRDLRLQKLASYDTLTGLRNRSYFIKILDNAIDRGQRKSYQHAIMFLDLDQFKRINDSLGHEVGDELLIEFASRLKQVLRSEDTIARLGGDEFSILLQETGVSQAEEAAMRILEALEFVFDLHGHAIFVNSSIGIVMFPRHGHEPSELLRHADMAMYKAKRNGGKGYCFFSKELTINAQQRLKLEERLQYAVKKDEILLHFQPRVSLQSGQIPKVEALCRWHYRHRKLFAPNEFLPLANETGLIIPIGNEIFRKSMEALQRLNSNGHEKIGMSVNISPVQLHDRNAIESLFRTLEEYRVDPALVELEITEEALIDSSGQVIDILYQIKDQGMTLAIDDFGTGYSSLSYLKSLPFDVLKIDRSFIMGIEENQKSHDIVRAAITMAHALKLEVVAEGVETRQQMQILENMGCNEVQGYFISRPLDEQTLLSFLEQQQRHQSEQHIKVTKLSSN